jgi:DNA primase
VRFPEYKIEEIRAAADIVDIVGGFLRLKKTGRNFTGLCPFHQEKTPSFNVNPERGIYKCFGCGKGGNAFTFLMEIEKISFHEAVVELAERYHVTLPKESEKAKESEQDLDALYEVNRLAGRFFHDALQTDRGSEAREYFRRRRWDADTQRMFGLGYAPDAWDAFITHARGQGHSDDILEQAGLVIRKDTGRVYDRFRNRAMFPIFSVTKKVIGFGARTMIPGEEPKYLNSPETPIYVKSRVLYGLSHAVAEIRSRDAVILVEGYADVISMHQAGIRNVIATSGTALTPEQVRILMRYSKNLFFLYDADSAGFAAMMRGVDILLEQDCDPRIVRLPEGEDPDSFVQRFGNDELMARVAEGVSFVDYVAERYQSSGKLQSPEEQTTAIRHIVSLIAKMEDKIRRDLYVHHVAERFKVYENILYEELEAQLRKKKRDRREANERRPVLPDDEEAQTVEVPLPKKEKLLLSDFFTAAPDLQVRVLRAVRIDDFRDKRYQYLLHLMLEQFEHEGTIDPVHLEIRLGDDVTMQGIIADLLISGETVSEKWNDIQVVTPADKHKALLDALKTLRKLDFDRRSKKYQELLRLLGADMEQEKHLARIDNSMKMAKIRIDQASTFEALADVDIDSGRNEDSILQTTDSP